MERTYPQCPRVSIGDTSVSECRPIIHGQKPEGLEADATSWPVIGLFGVFAYVAVVAAVAEILVIIRDAYDVNTVEVMDSEADRFEQFGEVGSG